MKPYFQRHLFQDHQLPYLTQEAMHGILEPHFGLLREVILEPWDDYQDSRGTDRRFENWREEHIGVWITQQANFWAKDHLVHSAFRTVMVHRKPIFIVDEKIALTIKKVTKRRNHKTRKPELQRSGYPTVRNVKYWEQRRSEDVVNYPRVILGYELLNEATGINIWLAYPRSKGYGFEWAFRIPATARLVPAPVINTTPTEAEEKGYQITRTAAAAEKHTNESA